MKKYSMFLGRFCPLHLGHRTIIDKVLAEGKNILIAIKLTGPNKKNPYSYSERHMRIRKFYPDANKVKIIPLPNVEEVCYGRKVGWGIRKIEVDKKTEAISGTKIRANMKNK